MRFLSKIFSKPIDPNKLIDFTTRALNNLNFTNQERAEFNMKNADNLAEFVKNTLSESTDRAVTRRYISVYYIAFYSLIALAILVVSMVDIDKATVLLKVASELNLTIGFILVMAFFFGGYYLGGVINQKSGLFSKKE